MSNKPKLTPGTESELRQAASDYWRHPSPEDWRSGRRDGMKRKRTARPRDYGPGEHPNSRANLRPPWKSGESGNPKGRPTGEMLYTQQNFNRLFRGDAAILDRFLREAPSPKPQQPKKEAVAIVMKERVQCSACRHNELPVIDGLLTLAIPIRVVARNFGLTRSSVDRHKRHHLPTFHKAETAREVMNAEALLCPILVGLKRTHLVNFEGEARTAANKLWDIFMGTLDDSPENRLRLCLANAFVWLYRVDGRESRYQVYDERNLPEFRNAIAALEAWWDGNGREKT